MRITETKLKRLEKKFIDIRNHKGGGTIVVNTDKYGRWCDRDDGHLLTREEVNSIRKECKQEDKILIIIGWKPFEKLSKGMSKFG